MAEHELLPWQSEDDVPPEQVETPAGPMGLHPGQQEVYDGLKRFNVIAAGRRWGKSYFCVKLACWWLRHSHTEDGTSLKHAPVWYVSPTIDLALEQIAPLIIEELGDECVQHHKVQNWFQHENGRRLYLKSANRPDNLKGRGIGGLIADEISIYSPGVWEVVLRPMLVDYQSPCALIGTPVGKGRLFDLYQYACTGGDEEWAGWQFKTIENPTISRDEVDKAARVMTASQFKQEFEADWSVGGGNVFNSKHLKIGKFTRGVYQIAAVFGSAAPFAKDATAVSGSKAAIIVLCMHPTGWHVISAQTGYWSVSDTVRRISDASKKYAPRFLAVSTRDRKASENLFKEYQRHQDFRMVPRFMEIYDPDDIDRIQWALQSRLKEGRVTCQKGKGHQQLTSQLQDFPLEYSNSELVQALSYFDQLPPPNFGRNTRQHFQPLDHVAGY